jgi:hypothetical protein
VSSVGFYQKFIANFGAIAEPLYNFLHGGTSWCWSQQCADAFTRLRKALVTAPVLAHFNTKARTTVDSDASHFAVDCVLIQMQGGVERCSTVQVSLIVWLIC